ncbi:META domain-containing protein [Pseudoalteromonas espejiana]
MAKQQFQFQKRTLSSLGLLALSAFTLAGCEKPVNESQHTTQEKTVRGLTTLVNYSDSSKPRPGSQLIVTLSDVSKADVTAEIITQQVVDINKAPPYTVELVYDAHNINNKNRYSLTARIINKDKVLYTSTTQYDPFKSAQSGVPHEIELDRVAEKKADVTLTNTYWKAVTINAQAVSVRTKEPFIQLDKDNRVNGFLGCNSVSGSYSTEQQSISFSQLASTKKMCSENMEQESAMLNVLNNTKNWAITGESLQLKDSSNTTLATFNAVYFN